MIIKLYRYIYQVTVPYKAANLGEIRTMPWTPREWESFPILSKQNLLLTETREVEIDETLLIDTSTLEVNHE